MQTASASDVERLLGAFRAVTWPADRGAAEGIARELGWSATGETRSYMTFATGLAVSSDRATALVAHDGAEVDEVSVAVSSASRSSAEVASAYAQVRRTVEAVVGPHVRTDDQDAPRTVWDLPSGGRVVVQQLDVVVHLIVLSQESAELERTEEAWGIDAGRVPGTGHVHR